MRYHLSVLPASMTRWQRPFSVAVRGDRGASAVEYGLIVALIAVAVLMAVVVLGSQLSEMFGNASDI